VRKSLTALPRSVVPKNHRRVSPGGHPKQKLAKRELSDGVTRLKAVLVGNRDGERPSTVGDVRFGVLELVAESDQCSDYQKVVLWIGVNWRVWPRLRIKTLGSYKAKY